MPKKTIYDIAKKAGVSIATVSKVMNKNSEISNKTSKRVLGIADEMGYYPHAYAQKLAQNKKNRIMILVPLISNYFFMEVLGGIQDEILEGFELNIFNISGQGENIYSQVETAIKRQVADGYILISIHLKEKQLQNLLKYDAVLSLIDEKFSKLDSVVGNNEEGARKAVDYFIGCGYRQIACISASATSKPNILRTESYKETLGQAQISTNETLIVTGESMERDGFTEQNGYEAMKKLLNLPQLPEACFCVSDIQAIGALKAMRENNVKIPLIGYDDIAISEYIGLSTIRQPMYQMGKEAMQRLFKKLKDPALKPKQKIFQPELILRESTDMD